MLQGIALKSYAILLLAIESAIIDAIFIDTITQQFGCYHKRLGIARIISKIASISNKPHIEIRCSEFTQLFFKPQSHHHAEREFTSR